MGSPKSRGNGSGVFPAGWPRMGKNSMVRRGAMLIVLFILVYLFTALNMSLVTTNNSPRHSTIVKAEMVHLSEEYIRALASENGGIVDGPYAGRFTAYDLKKTIAVLLESMLSRITRLEVMVNNVTNGSFLSDHVNANASFSRHLAVNLPSHHHSNKGKRKDSILSANDLLKGKSESCELSANDNRQYPHCKAKIEWMRKMWKSDSCYKEHGVDGSDCSIIMYLSEVEGYCPKQAWSGPQPNKTVTERNITYASMTDDLHGLMELLKDPNERQGYAWIRMRITRMWDQWKMAARNIAATQKLQQRPKQKILIHLGLLSKQTGWKFAENQFKGGPLGELVQWSDLISCLYILGHELQITSETEQLVEILNHVPAAKSPCQSRKELPVELIYTDIAGFTQLKKKLKAGYAKFGCMFRIVDSFGTEPAFNHKVFARQNKILTSWGGLDLHPLQFNTMFPHSPDNTFLGFVVERLLNDTDNINSHTKKDIALVYGKNDYMWLNKSKYLDIIHKYLQVHGTVYSGNTKLKYVPSYTINHGILSGPDLHKLLQQAKIFVGLGFPYEGPAALEAIANGAVFLNPKFNPPHSSKNNKFFKGKPTHREISSQHPYAEYFIGRPYVYTIDTNKPEEIEKAVKEILENKHFKPYLPFEYTEEGMLQRVNAFLLNQNFCAHSKKPGRPLWPPKHAVEILTAPVGKSCKDSCWDKNRICEPSYFPSINSYEVIKNLTNCSVESKASNIYYPAYDKTMKACTLQTEQLLFSCVGSSPTLQRICPCRNYIQGQMALCIGCER